MKLTLQLLLLISALSANAKIKSLRLDGSTTISPIFKVVGREFGPKNNIGISVGENGSEEGIKCARANTCDLGLSCRSLQPDEKSSVVFTHLGWDGIAFIVHPSNPVENLSKKEIVDIFSGKIKNWKEVGGVDLPIVPYGREDSRAIEEQFEEDFGLKPKYEPLGTNQATLNRMSIARSGITYISLGQAHADKRVKIVSYNKIAATPENLVSGKYPLRRELIAIRNKNAGNRVLIDKFVSQVVKRRLELFKPYGFIAD